MEGRFDRLTEFLLNYKGRLLGALVGLITGLIVVIYDWISGFYFLFCLGTGYYVGKLVDGKHSFRQILEKILPPGE